jgi:hypothetical protein
MRLAVAAVTLAACTRAAPPPCPACESASDADPYAAALEDAMYPRPSEAAASLLALTPGAPGVRFRDDGRVLVTTWSRRQYYGDAYVPGHTFPLYGETWFTAGTEVKDACRGLTGDALAARVEQRLGLPAGGGRDVFLQVWVDPTSLFRPCATRDVTAPTCVIAAPLVPGDGDQVSWACDPASDDAHARWLCATWVARYGASDPSRRFPWTALGYTYDWGAGDPIGAAEFVAPKGVEVELEALIPNDDFCAAAPSP